MLQLHFPFQLIKVYSNMKKIFVLLLLSCSCNVFSQEWPVKKMVVAKRQSNALFTALPVFSFVTNKTLAQRGTYQQLKLDPSFLDDIMRQRPEAIQLSIPFSNSKSIVCDLVQVSLGNIKFTETMMASLIMCGYPLPTGASSAANGKRTM